MGVKDWFSAFGGKREVQSDKKHSRQLRTRDTTGTIVANTALLEGLYHGTVPELQFASPFANVPINVPVALVGIPTPTADDDATKERLKLLIAEKTDEFPIIERDKLIYGTAWRWPRYDARRNLAVWEAIPDDCIEAIEYDVISGEIVAIYTHDKFTVSSGRDKTEQRERYRKITRERIEVKWVGPKGTLSDSSGANPFGHLPRPFGHDCNNGEWRGHSVYGRILRVMKAYHEIKLKQMQILAEFNPKLIHNVSDVKEWMANNGYTSIDAIDSDVFSSTFFLNKQGAEKTEMLYLASDATGGHDKAAKELEKAMIVGSNIPELFWGGLATGNAASTDIQKDQVIQYIQSLQTEDSTQYEGIFNDSLEILSFVEMRSYGKCMMAWDKIDMMSEETKAKVLQTVAGAISSVVTSCGGTKDDVFWFWKKFYPGLPEADITAFSAGLTEMAKHKAFSNTDAISQGETE